MIKLFQLFASDNFNLTRKMSSDLASFSALEKRLEELERRVHGTQMNKNEEMIIVPKLTGMYTQSLLIRNGGKFWLVPFLNFQLFLYRLCFLFFPRFCTVVSYSYLDFQYLISHFFYFSKIRTDILWGRTLISKTFEER